MGRSVQFGATLPGSGYSFLQATGGEIATTFALIAGLFLFVSQRRLRPFTPLLFPVLYAARVYLEAALSGTSTNPARSLGPLLLSMNWRGRWIHGVGPALGTLLAVALHRLSWLRVFQIEVAKLYHFEQDPYRVFRDFPNRPSPNLGPRGASPAPRGQAGPRAQG
jgi:aquaporin Z